MGLVSFLPPTITVEALKATHSTDPNQCHGLIFSLSRTGHPTQMDATPFMISFENRPTSFPGKREPNLGFFSCFSLFYVILFFCVSDAWLFYCIFLWLFLLVFDFVFFQYWPIDWLGTVAPKWRILCRVGCKTFTQSIFLTALQRKVPDAATVIFCPGQGTYISASFVSSYGLPYVVIGRPLYILLLQFLLPFFFFFSLLILSGCRLDVYHTSTHGVAFVQI